MNHPQIVVQNLGKTWISRVTPMEDGRVVVSGHGFFTIIDEEALKEPSPVVQIGQILQNGAPILPDEATGALQLAHDKNAFEVHYSVQPLALSTKLSYRHRLVGFDEDWLDGQDGEVGAFLLDVGLADRGSTDWKYRLPQTIIGRKWRL